MVSVKNLTKKYGGAVAIDNLNFEIGAGEIVGFLGPNGAGKTTTMNIMTGFIAATSGEVKIGGFDIATEAERAKKNIGYLPDTPPVYSDMRVCEYLNFVADIKGANENRKQVLGEIMEQVNIADVSRRIIRNLSRGYRQRVGLAQAMVGEPKVIIMDEPTIGLDPKQIIELREVIKTLGARHTVILSSHIMQEVSAVCDRVIIINRGKIIADGNAEDLRDNLPADGLHVRVKGELEAVEKALAEASLSASLELGTEPETVELFFETDLGEEIFYCMARNNLPILLMKPTELSLEEIFLSLVRAPSAQWTPGACVSGDAFPRSRE
ncbi:MAG: ABC transporter ATP-binding protein [Defluviitaleaceae bacterium]|nr:ABC transporter ATP-binding protein [Defluviitaleaceae bacterium]